MDIVKRHHLNFEAMNYEQRLLMNMYFKKFRYVDIWLYFGRMDIKYQGKTLRDSKSIYWLIYNLVNEFKHDKDQQYRL